MHSQFIQTSCGTKNIAVLLQGTNRIAVFQNRIGNQLNRNFISQHLLTNKFYNVTCQPLSEVSFLSDTIVNAKGPLGLIIPRVSIACFAAVIILAKSNGFSFKFNNAMFYPIITTLAVVNFFQPFARIPLPFPDMFLI